MKTLEQSPWVPYLEMDEETFESHLRPDAPDDIKKAYEDYQKKLQQCIENGEPIEK